MERGILQHACAEEKAVPLNVKDVYKRQKVRKEVQLWYEFLKQYKCLENTSYEDMVKAFEEESDKLKENLSLIHI